MCCLTFIYCLICFVLIWIKTTSTGLHSVYQSICSLAGKPCWCVHMLWLCFSANVVFLFPGQSPSQWSPIVLYTYCGCVSVVMWCFYFLASHQASEALLSCAHTMVVFQCFIPASEALLSCTHAVVVFHCWRGVSVSWLVTQPGKLYCHVHMLWLCFNADVVFLYPCQSPSQWSPIDMYTHCGCVSVLMWCFYFLASHPASETLLSCTHAVVVSVLMWCFYFLTSHPASEPHCPVHTLWLCVSADMVFLFPGHSPSQWSPLSCTHAVVVFQCWRGVSISWPVTQPVNPIVLYTHCGFVSVLTWCLYFLAIHPASEALCHVHMLWLCFSADVVFLFPGQSPSQWNPIVLYTHCGCMSVLMWCFCFLAIHPAS